MSKITDCHSTRKWRWSLPELYNCCGVCSNDILGEVDLTFGYWKFINCSHVPSHCFESNQESRKCGPSTPKFSPFILFLQICLRVAAESSDILLFRGPNRNNSQNIQTSLIAEWFSLPFICIIYIRNPNLCISCCRHENSSHCFRRACHYRLVLHWFT